MPILALLIALVFSGCVYQATSQYAPLKMFAQERVETDRTIWETKYWRVVLNENQSYLGRAVVRLRRACGDIACVTKEELDEWHTVAAMVQDAARSAFGATMFNWDLLMNHAYRDDPPTPLVHWHFVPRYRDPVNFAGEIFTDNRFGNNWPGRSERKVNKEVVQQIIRAYREELQKLAGN